MRVVGPLPKTDTPPQPPALVLASRVQVLPSNL